MKKIKILYEGLSANMGGIETYIYNLQQKMTKYGNIRLDKGK